MDPGDRCPSSCPVRSARPGLKHTITTDHPRDYTIHVRIHVWYSCILTVSWLNGWLVPRELGSSGALGKSRRCKSVRDGTPRGMVRCWVGVRWFPDAPHAFRARSARNELATVLRVPSELHPTDPSCAPMCVS